MDYSWRKMERAQFLRDATSWKAKNRNHSSCYKNEIKWNARDEIFGKTPILPEAHESTPEAAVQRHLRRRPGTGKGWWASCILTAVLWHFTTSLIPSMNKTSGYFSLYTNQVLKAKLVFSSTICTQASKKYQVKEEHDIKVSAWLSQKSWKIRTSKQLQMILHLESFCSHYPKDWLWNISVYLHYQICAWNKQCLIEVHRHSCICTWIFKVIRPF